MTFRVPIVYGRPDLCPQCWAALRGPVCGQCGLRLVPPLADRVLDAGRRIDDWLAVRGAALPAAERVESAPAVGELPARAPVTGAVPVVYDRPELCPRCWTASTGGPCTRCGLLPPAGADGVVRLAGRRIDEWLAERSRLITALRSGPSLPPPPVLAPVAFAAPDPATSMGVPAATTGLDVAPAPRPPELVPASPGLPATRADRRRFWKVAPQIMLVGVGALLLAVAAVIFLALTWDRMGIAGRSLVVGGTTAATIAISAWLRPRLAVTAEAMGWLSVVLLVLDAAAVRASGLAGDGLRLTTYIAVACGVLAASYAGLATLTRVRAYAWAGAVSVPVVPLLGAAAVAVELHDRSFEWVWVLTAVGVGSLLAALAGAASERLSGGGRAGRVSAWLGVAALIPLGPVAVLVAGSGSAGVVLAGAAAVAAVLHTLLLPRLRGGASLLLGGAVSLAIACPVIDLVEVWWTTLVAAGIGGFVLACALVAARMGKPRSGPLPLVTGLAGICGLVVFALPTLVSTGLRLLTVPVAWSQPWSATANTGWRRYAVLGSAPVDVTTAAVLALLVVGVSLFSWGRITRSAAAVQASLWTLGALTVTLPWFPGLTVAAVVGSGLCLGAVLVLGGRLLRGHPGLPGAAVVGPVCGSVLGTLAVTAAWTVETLAVPVTLLGVAALVFAWWRTRQSWLWIPVVISLVVCAAALAVSAGWRGTDLTLPVIWLSSALLVLAVTIPAERLAASDRHALALTSVLCAAPAVLTLLLSADGWASPPGRISVTAFVVAGCAAALAVDPRQVLPEPARLGAIPASVACLGWGLLTGWSFLGWSDEAVALAAAAAVAALVFGFTRGRMPVRWRLTLEISAHVVAGVAVPLAWWQPVAWPALFLVAGALTVPTLERRPLAWAAWAIGSVGLGDLLWHTPTREIEWFTLPPALVLLAAGGWAARQDGRVLRPALLAGGLLLVVPSAAVGSAGPMWRPIAVLLVVLAAAAAVIAVRRVGADLAGLAEVVAVPSAAALIAGPWLRGVRMVVTGGPVEVWVLAAAIGFAALAALGWRWAVARSAVVILWVSTVPLLAAVDGATATLVRVLAVIVVSGVLLVVCGLAKPGAAHSGVLFGNSMAVLTLAVLVGSAGQVLLTGGHPVDLVTAPAAVFVVGYGTARMWRGLDSSWTWVGPGLLVGFAPSLMLSLGGGSVLRVVLVFLAGAAVVAAGAAWQWQAPLLVGTGVLVTHAVLQLSPYASLVYLSVPRWVTMALVGVCLLALGARYERRVANVVAIRRHLRALR